MTTRTKQRKSNYITTDTAEGKKILNYLRNRCEKALDYCLEQGLTGVEDFADAVEELTDADGKPGISVSVKHNGIILSLSDHPEYGTTTGKYMMEHLGEPDDTRFTKTGIEALLNPVKSNYRQQDSFLDLLEDDASTPKTKANKTNILKSDLLDRIEIPETPAKTTRHTRNTLEDDVTGGTDDSSVPPIKTKAKTVQIKLGSQPDTSLDDIDDLLDEIDEEKVIATPSKTASSKSASKTAKQQLDNEGRSNNQQSHQHKSSNSIDDILDIATQVSARAAIQGSEIDGTTVGGLSTQLAFLAAAIGKNEAQKLLEVAQKTGQKKQIFDIVTRLEKQSLRADKLAQRAEKFEEEEEREEFKNEIITAVEQENESKLKSFDKLNLPETTTRSPLPTEPDVFDTIAPEVAGALLAKAVSKVAQKVDNVSDFVGGGAEAKPARIEIDKNASFSQQIAQINEAIDRLEKRLDALENRIEALEKAWELKFAPSASMEPIARVKTEPTDENFIKSDSPDTDCMNNSPDTSHLSAAKLPQKPLDEPHFSAAKSAQKPLDEPHFSAAKSAQKPLDEPYFSTTKSPHSPDELLTNFTQPSDRLPSAVEIKSVDNSGDRNSSGDSPSQIAQILVQIHTLAEEEAIAAGVKLSDGVDLGAAKLYATIQGKSTTVSLKTQEGDELFLATSSNGKWKVITDSLSPQEKQEIRSLETFQQAIDQERLALLLGNSSQEAASFTTSLGRRLNFEVEVDSKSNRIIRGFNEYDEVIFEAAVQKGRVEVLQCDIPAEEVENLLSQHDRTDTKQETRKKSPEIEI
ncbi:MAG: hypothetical protein MUE44_28810 [Oscillatoriaceae cyanobacterium Prado104]|jgi:hypothetical protein|nr:hypothetical protein [Oscillatoriaceae cyanobacterium Prado104]